MIRFSGKVIRGDGYGTQLGYPTANLDRRQFLRLEAKVRYGVYAGRASLTGGRRYPAAIVIGPDDKKGLPKLEAHLLGYSGNLYGRMVTLSLHKFLRPFAKFPNVQSLIKQIDRDIKQVSKIIPK